MWRDGDTFPASAIILKDCHDVGRPIQVFMVEHGVKPIRYTSHFASANDNSYVHFTAFGENVNAKFANSASKGH